MKILMTTWEFPPMKVGGIASHCYDLSRELMKEGHDVHVLTFGPEEKDEIVDGVYVHRIPSGHAPDTISWANFLGHRMEKKAIELNKEEKFEVVHAHDWMMVPAGVAIKKTLRLPLVFTLHSTEYGRVGIHTRYSKMINDLEWYGTYEANEVITVGKDFYNEVRSLFKVPEEKIHYIPNGVDIERFDIKPTVSKDEFAAGWEKMILFVGRLTYQKGLEFLISSMPQILRDHPESKFVIVGRGEVERYRHMAESLGIGEKTYFTGFLPEETVISLFKLADAVAIPSVYEPFGIVALEAAAASSPAVGSYVGGLKETIIHEKTGLHTIPKNNNSIKDQLDRVLSDPGWGKWLGRNGRKNAEKNYKWSKISKWTTGVYGKAMGLW